MTTDGDTTQGERIERVAEALGLAHEIPGGSKSIYARALDDFVALTTTLSEQEAELERLRYTRDYLMGRLERLQEQLARHGHHCCVALSREDK